MAEKCGSKGKSTTNIFDYTHTVQRNYLVALSLAAMDTSNSPLASAFSPDPSLLSSYLESLLGIPDVCHDYDKRLSAFQLYGKTGRSGGTTNGTVLPTGNSIRRSPNTRFY